MNLRASFRFIRRYLAARERVLWLPLRSGALRVTMRHWIVPILWLIVTLFAYQTNHSLFFRLSYLMLFLGIFAFLWTWYQVATFRLECKTITPRTQVGHFLEEQFLAHNTGRVTKVWIEVRDQSELPVHHSSRVLNALGAHRRWGWTTRTLCWQRGRFRLGPITAITGDPFGLFLFQRRMNGTTRTIVVYPATVDLPTFAPARGQLAGGEALQRRTHHITTNVAGTREYAPGDSFSRIHWRSTARMERLIVKEFELDPTADVWVYLDLERAVHAHQAYDQTRRDGNLAWLWWAAAQWRLPPSTEEYSVTIAASVAKYFLRHQRAVGFVAYAHAREIVPPDRGERQLTRLLEILAVLRAEGWLRFADVLALEGARLARNHTLVAVTPSAELDGVRVLCEIKRRGVAVITVLVDANTFGGRADTERAAVELVASGIPTYIVKYGDDLSRVLGRVSTLPAKERD